MKILKIRIKNLNSLRLETEIDFSKTPFLDTGLFAIVGDTGAGKTTILDAITLGLYGKIHRNKQVVEVMSYGAVDCMAEVEFEVKNKRYLSHWDIYRARKKLDGKIQPATRQIRVWEEKEKAFLVLTDRIREVDEKIEEITGLDYDRFCRSVLLSQGDFAAFLRSNEKERSDLLERITGTEIYSQISKASFGRMKAEEQKLHEIQQKLEGLQLLDKEEVKELKATLKDKKEEGKVAKNQLDELRKQQQWLQNIGNLERKKHVLEEQKTQLEQQKQQQEQDLTRLTAHQKTIPFHKNLDRYDDNQLKINQLRHSIQKTEQVIADFAQQEQDLQATLTAQQTALSNLKKERTPKEKLFNTVVKLDVAIQQQEQPLQRKILEEKEAENELKQQKVKLTNLQQKLKRINEQLTKEKIWLKENRAWTTLPKQFESIKSLCFQIGPANKNLAQTKIEEKELTTTLKKAQKEEQQAVENLEKIRNEKEDKEKEFRTNLPEKYTLSRGDLLVALNQEIEQLNTKQKKLAELQQLNAEYREMITEFEEYRQELKNEELRRAQLDVEVLNLMEDRDQLKKQVDFKVEIYQQQLAIANYDKDRAKLQEGEECPLCLSTEHPFRSKDFKPYVDKAKLELEQAETVFGKVDVQLKSLVNEQTKLSLKIAELQGEEIEKLGGRMEKKMERIRLAESRFAGAISIYDSEDFATVDSSFFEQKIGLFSQEIEEKKKLRISLQKLNTQLETLQKQEQRLANEWRELQLTVQEKLQKSNYNQQKIKELKESIEQTTLDLANKLSPYQIEFSLENGNSIFKELEEKSSAIEHNQVALQKLEKEVEVLEKERDLLEKSLQEKQARFDKRSIEITKEKTHLATQKEKRFDLFADKNVELERQKFQNALETNEQQVEKSKKQMAGIVLQLKTNRNQLTSQQKELASGVKLSQEIHAKILERLANTDFVDIDTLRAAILPEEVAARIAETEKIIREKESENTQLLKAVLADLEEEKAKRIVEIEGEELLRDLNTKEELFQQLQQAIGSLDQQLKANAARKKDSKDLLQNLDNQRKELNRWKALADLIGSADGKKFRVFAQGLTLKKLVQLANHHLENLNGRYVILKPDDQDLTLDIMDTFQADNVRSMNTLSGGESFLVSLALALGLSDLAGRNTNIRSLFIDEGFGTLDESTLDLAITTLENLQSGGKTIGIISHVKELKERITTQIRVRKQGSGFSELEIVG